jgi:hypothetical protein
MKQVVARVARDMPLQIDEVDISLDLALEAQYGLEVPVLIVAGKRAAKYRVTEEVLKRVLRAAQDRPGAAGTKGATSAGG